MDANGKYKFTEKERDALTNYDYFGARYYISRLGRWMTVDPLADDFYGWSPYNYTMCNPLNLVDIDGQVPADPLTLTAGAATAVVIGGAIIATAAAIEITENTKNTGRVPTQLEMGMVLTKKAVDLWNDFTNLFSDDEKQTGGGGGSEENSKGGTQTKEQLEQAKASHEGRINEHKEKLEQYKNNPESCDNKGKLKNAKPEHKEKIIEGRKKVLEKAIKKHEGELKKVIDALNKF
ncbi:MAG: RHS repeat-associated core domain-containing protein [bacterium]